jgi:hypothetical protein
LTEDVGLDALFEPPSEPDATRLIRVPKPVTEYVITDRPARQCKNAGLDLKHIKRPAPHPGPRCATCQKAKQRADKKRAAELKVENLYGLTPEEYDELYKAQGGKCYVCQRATGRRKRLAVDHDHVLAFLHKHAPGYGCKFCVRGLACGVCNETILGRLGGNPATYDRIAFELRNPPARRLFGGDTAWVTVSEN